MTLGPGQYTRPPPHPSWADDYEAWKKSRSRTARLEFALRATGNPSFWARSRRAGLAALPKRGSQQLQQEAARRRK